MALIVPSSFYRIDAGLHALSFSPGFNVHTVFKIDTIIYRNKLFTDEFHYMSKPSSTVVPMVLLEMNHKMYRDCVYYRIKRIFAGVYLCITWTNSLTNK